MNKKVLSIATACLALVLFFAIPSKVNAQGGCTFAGDLIVCPGFVNGQVENGTFGTFTGSEEWSALGKAPFPAPNGDLPYGLRLQRGGVSTLYQIDRRAANVKKFDSDISFGDVLTPQSLETFQANGPTRLDVSYFLQNQNVFPPTVSKYDIVTVLPATSKQISIGGPSLFCFSPIGFSQPCFGRVGIERTNPSFTLDVNGLLRVQATVIASDARLKKDINTIENGMSVINNLRGTTYEYRADEDFGEAEFDFGEGLAAGFIAQEVEEILPHLVATDDQGYKAVNYDGVIPYLVEGMKELSAENKILKQEIAALRSEMTTGAAKGDGALGTMAPAQLFQNVPNPFDRETEIRYFLPENSGQAQLLVFDMNGRQLRSYDLREAGEGSVTIQGNDLEAGMYFYSLVANGEEISTKRMILTK